MTFQYLFKSGVVQILRGFPFLLAPKLFKSGLRKGVFGLLTLSREYRFEFLW